MSKEQLQQRLLGVFLEELEEHRQALSRDLLALESQHDPDQRRALLESMFRSAHSLKGAARSTQIVSIERICHRLEQHFQDLRQGRESLTDAMIRGWFGELDELTAEAEKLTASRTAKPLKTPEQADKPSQDPQEAPSDKRVLRISTDKADTLLNQAADLVTLASMLEARLADFEELRGLVRELRLPRDPTERERTLHKLERALEQSEEGFRRGIHAVLRGGERLDDETQRLRLVPFAEACEGLDRAARDLSLSLGKPFELSIASGGVEIDRAIAQRLRDPLLHLLRNAVTHGIESASERARNGKPAAARVRIEAALRGKSVEVVLSDDGRGFDLQRIRAQAVSMQLNTAVSERELLAYTFLPGFSTASSVTELSGRGVGLDVVKRTVETIHGTVEVDSRTGAGTRFVLHLPLTLSKLRCVFVMAAGRWYAIPASHIVRVQQFSRATLVSLEGRTLVRSEGALLPLASLAQVLGLKDQNREPRESSALLILSGEERNVALLVDELGAEREITARALPKRLRGAHQVSSVTFLALGRVALVLHPHELCRRAQHKPFSGESAEGPRSVAARPRILVAEDSATTRAVLKSLLEEAHYEVTTAQDGEEAFSLLQQRSFDLVLSDVQMPHKDGFSLTESIRAHERLARLPVVLMTSLDSEADRLQGLRAGASAYLTKSTFDHPILLETIASLL